MEHSEIKPGMQLEVWCEGGKYRPCTIIKEATYVGRSGPGWDYRFDGSIARDPETGISPSAGGWAPARYFRKVNT